MEHVDDYLIPHLVNLEFPETLSATDIENLVAKCVQELKENRKAVANFLQEHHKKVEQHLTQQLPWRLLPSMKYQRQQELYPQFNVLVLNGSLQMCNIHLAGLSVVSSTKMTKHNGM